MARASRVRVRAVARCNPTKYLKEDPQDCSMYYRCDTGGRVHHMQCSQGTSFDPNWSNGYGNCVGPDPKYIPDCYSDDDGDDDD